MEEQRRNIFRADAMRRLSATRERTVLPRFVSPRLVAAVWMLLLLLMAWCYGAPGIGLSRLRMLRHMNHELLREEAETALRTTLARGFGTNHSICHGDLGNMDFLLQANEALEHPELDARINRLTNIILESIRRNGWLCGVPLGVESPALMNGLAGICYGLLRLAEPHRVPSVLILATPVM